MKKWHLAPGLLVVLLCGLSVLGFQGKFFQTAAHADVTNGTPPPYTTSWYKTTLNATTSQNEGCNAAQGNTGMVILAYGEPYYSGSSYGTLLTQVNTFAADSDIESNVISFLRGANYCSKAGTNLKVAVGTSNDNSEGLSLSQLTAAGQAWANIVNDARNYIAANSHITVYGADDIEIDFSPFNQAQAFVDGYNQNTSALLVDFGDDPSGPSSVDPDPARGWTAQALWYVTSGTRDAVVIPEIYTSGQVTEWVNLDAWACANEGRGVSFYGTISDAPYGGHYSPDIAWSNLYNALRSSSSSCVQQSAMRLFYSTDISS